MAARNFLALAALATLLALASCSSLRNIRPRPGRAADVQTFAWASVQVVTDKNSEGKRVLPTCDMACRKYGLSPILSPSNATMCRFTLNATTSVTVYGTYQNRTYFDYSPDVDIKTLFAGCWGVLANGTKVNSIQLDRPYFCGCCGVINRRGVAPTACPADVVTSVASDAACPTGVAWTPGAGGDGSTVCMRNTVDGVAQFGQIYNGNCSIYNITAPNSSWQRMCMRAQNAP